MTISIVIPVYNEAAHLADCLQAISRQRVAPLEVIVVDNNSTDVSIKIAKAFSFVRVVREKRQGVVYARNRGFDQARGDIIGRIDADTLIPANWTQTVLDLFIMSPARDALSGSIYYHDMPYPAISAKFDLHFRESIADKMGEEMFLYGANMALRRTSWQQVKSQVCARSGLHEDFDLAIHLHDLGLSVGFEEKLQAGVSLRRYDGRIRDFWEYTILGQRTYAFHGRTTQRYMYPMIGVVLSTYWFLKLIHRAFDPKTLKFSLQKLFLPGEKVRVNPATFVD